MKNRKPLLGALLLGGLLLGGTAQATPSGEMLGNTCSGCHGTHGVSMGPASPTIAGISKAYFVDAMKAYRAGERPATIMNRIAKGYTDEEIEAMAVFFSGMSYEPQQQKFDAALAKKGAVLHKQFCEKCHEDGGTSSEDDAGLLGGQWTPYLSYTFEDFKAGTREMPKKMKKKVEELQLKAGDEGLPALLNFYASQGK